MTEASDKPVLGRFSLGSTTVTALSGGRLWLDGGAMFGIIPKPLWSKSVKADESNRIPLGMTCLLIETEGKRILVETGAGPTSKYSEKDRGFFGFSENWIVPSLATWGVPPEEIDIVVLTHLHFDHAGGATRPDKSGGFVPAFPRAKYFVQRGEWDDAVNGHAVMTGTYRRENLEPLEQAGLVSFLNGPAEIAKGLEVRLLPGHTRHQQGVWITGGGRTLVQPADMMPTSAHVGLRHNMAYDLMPHENMVGKRQLISQAVEKGWTLILGQDPAHCAWQPRQIGEGRFELGRVELDPL